MLAHEFSPYRKQDKVVVDYGEDRAARVVLEKIVI
jgi:hypothetical protein